MSTPEVAGTQEPHNDTNTDTKKPDWKDNAILFVVVVILVFVTRLPFVDAGYGYEADSWRVANAAKEIAETGEYTASRPPGYPVQEIACSLIVGGGAIALNSASALLCAIAAGFFVLSVKALGFRNYFIAALALAFTPILYVCSVSSKDYPWALAFIMASMYFVILRKPLFAGILLGLGIGCRLSSALVYPVFFLMLLKEGGIKGNLKDILKFSSGTLFLGMLSYVPVALRYGLGFFEIPSVYLENPPGADFIIHGATVGVWGRIGFWAILLAIALVVIRLIITRSVIPVPATGRRYDTIAWIVAVCLYVALFIRLPQQSGYLIPAIPFVILLLLKYLSRRMMTIICLLLIISPFFCTIITEGENAKSHSPKYLARFKITGKQYALDWRGAILRDHAVRIERQRFLNKVMTSIDRLDDKSVVVSGSWSPQLRFLLRDDPEGMAKYVYLLNEAELRSYLDDGCSIWYLPGQLQLNMNVHGIDLRAYGAQQLYLD